MNKYLFIILFLISIPTFGKDFKIIKKIGNFNNSSSFSYSNIGYFYISDIGNNEIIKIDTLGKIKNSIGGFGWKPSTFDEPVDIFYSTLSIYVADKNNNRIQIFDKDLHYLSHLPKNNNNENYEFSYPLCTAISVTGDLFILDSENSKILKFDLNGNFLLEIGSNNSGDFSLTLPLYFAISEEGKIFVLDENRIIVYDQFGNGLAKYKLKNKIQKIFINKNQIFTIAENEISNYTIPNILKKNYSLHIDDFNKNEEFIDIEVSKNLLFILTDKHIYTTIEIK